MSSFDLPQFPKSDKIQSLSHWKMKSCHLSFLFLSLFLSAAAGDSDNDCVYTLFVKTGSIFKAGTDAKISVTLGDSTGRSVWVPDLKQWGVMGPNHNYYERDNVDAFSGRGPCIRSPICRLNVTSDGSGSYHGWYCDYVEVTSTGPHKPCSQTLFFVDQWLADDAPPFELTAVLDGCHSAAEKSGKLVVRKPRISSAY